MALKADARRLARDMHAQVVASAAAAEDLEQQLASRQAMLQVGNPGHVLECRVVAIGPGKSGATAQGDADAHSKMLTGALHRRANAFQAYRRLCCRAVSSKLVI